MDEPVSFNRSIYLQVQLELGPSYVIDITRGFLLTFSIDEANLKL